MYFLFLLSMCHWCNKQRPPAELHLEMPASMAHSLHWPLPRQSTVGNRVHVCRLAHPLFHHVDLRRSADVRPGEPPIQVENSSSRSVHRIWGHLTSIRHTSSYWCFESNFRRNIKSSNFGKCLCSVGQYSYNIRYNMCHHPLDARSIIC